MKTVFEMKQMDSKVETGGFVLTNSFDTLFIKAKKRIILNLVVGSNTFNRIKLKKDYQIKHVEEQTSLFVVDSVGRVKKVVSADYVNVGHTDNKYEVQWDYYRKSDPFVMEVLPCATPESNRELMVLSILTGPNGKKRELPYKNVHSVPVKKNRNNELVRLVAHCREVLGFQNLGFKREGTTTIMELYRNRGGGSLWLRRSAPGMHGFFYSNKVTPLTEQEENELVDLSSEVMLKWRYLDGIKGELNLTEHFGLEF